MENLIGKYFTLFNFDGSILTKFKIRFVKSETRKSKTHEDNSFSPQFNSVFVSENNSGFYQVYSGLTDLISNN